MEKQYRKLARRFYRYLRHPRRRRNSRVLRWVGDRFADRRLWRPTTQSFAPGLATGFGVAMLPFFIPQMLVAAIICLWRRWNLPLALAACWISNAFTWVLQFIWQVRLGNWMLSVLGLESDYTEEELEEIVLAQELEMEIELTWWERLMENYRLFMDFALPWTIGVIISIPIAVLVGYLLGKILWSFVGHRVPVPHELPRRKKVTGEVREKAD